MYDPRYPRRPRQEDGATVGVDDTRARKCWRHLTYEIECICCVCLVLARTGQGHTHIGTQASRILRLVDLRRKGLQGLRLENGTHGHVDALPLFPHFEEQDLREDGMSAFLEEVGAGNEHASRAIG